jgi:hypothetical protein
MSELSGAVSRIEGDLDAVGPVAGAVDTSTDALRTVLAELERLRAIEQRAVQVRDTHGIRGTRLAASWILTGDSRATVR